MSGFILNGMGLPNTIHTRDDKRACDTLYFGKRSRAPDPYLLATESRGTADNAHDAFVYQTRWWPRSGQIMGGWGDGLTGDIFQSKSPRFKAPRIERGANGRLAFVGYTRDQYGSALGGCTVRCYRVATEEQVSKVVSDANGLYFATSPYNDAHFLVIHNPDGSLAGATNTSLLPA